MKYEIKDNFHKFFDDTLPIISFRFMSENDYSEKQVKTIINGVMGSFFLRNDKPITANLYSKILERDSIYFTKVKIGDEDDIYYIYEK